MASKIYKTLWTGAKNGLLISMLGKLNWLHDRSNNNGSIDVKMDGSALEEKSSFKMLGLTFSSKLDYWSFIISIAKTVFKKIGALTRSMKLLSPEIDLHLYKSAYTHVWNTLVMPGLVPLVANWNCKTSYKNKYAGLLVLHLLLLLNIWVTVKMWPA